MSSSRILLIVSSHFYLCQEITDMFDFGVAHQKEVWIKDLDTFNSQT